MSDALQHLFVLGSSHLQAPLELRERFSLNRETAADLNVRLAQLPELEEALVLNTCNRIEIYGLAAAPGAEERARDLVCQICGAGRSVFDAHSFHFNNLQAIEHTLEVAAGLESQMVGETEIFQQMKSAYAEARRAGATGWVLNRLFERAFHAAKQARSQTGLTRGQISVGNVTVDLARRIFGKLADSRVLLVGSGEVAEKTAQALSSRGVSDITVSGRNLDRARKLAHRFAAAALDFTDFPAQLHHFDIVVCSTAASGTLIDAAMVRAVIRRRPDRPIFLIDLAVPRDIDPSAADLPNVYLYNLDDLSAMANENLALRRAEIEQARALLRRQAWHLWLHLRRRSLFEINGQRAEPQSQPQPKSAEA